MGIRNGSFSYYTFRHWLKFFRQVRDVFLQRDTWADGGQYLAWGQHLSFDPAWGSHRQKKQLSGKVFHGEPGQWARDFLCCSGQGLRKEQMVSSSRNREEFNKRLFTKVLWGYFRETNKRGCCDSGVERSCVQEEPFHPLRGALRTGAPLNVKR